MLSHIYRITRDFEHTHQLRANAIFLNPAQFAQLRRQFADDLDMEQICALLGLAVIIRRDTPHPRVAWLHTARRLAS